MKRYTQILKQYRGSLLLSPFLVLIAVLCETIQPMYMARIVDEGVMHADLSLVLRLGLYMVLISFAGLLVTVLNVYISARASIGFATDLRALLFSKIQSLSFFDIDRFNPSSLITRLTNDVTKIQHVVQMGMRLMLRAPMLLVLAVLFVVRINAQLAVVLLAAIPVLGGSIFLILRFGFPLFMRVQQQIDRLNETVRENLINIRVVKSFVREDFAAKRFAVSNEELRDKAIRAANMVVALFPVMQLVMNVSVIAILWVGGAKVMQGELKVGELISFVNYLMQVMMALMFMAMIMMGVVRASASSSRILEVLDTEPSLSDTSEGIADTYRITKGDIIFRNVSFRYSGGDADVLKNVSFEVKPCETIAIVGATGAAKSTLLQLIPRLFDVTEGEILIDHVPLKNYSLNELHSRIGVVLQKNELFTGTIADNLRWGKEDATDEELVWACRAAQAHDFISSFNEGYHTLLGRGGVNISGGQKQRICLARALLRKPKILILDDSTSAIDAETEMKIKHNLTQMLRDTTIIIVTQRVHAMLSANRVLVLDDGEVEAIGTPEALMQSSKVFQEIVRSQAGVSFRM